MPYASLKNWLAAEDNRLRKRFTVLCEKRVRELCQQLHPKVRIREISVTSHYWPVGDDVLVREEDGDRRCADVFRLAETCTRRAE